MLVLLLLCCVPLALAEPITAGCCFPRQWTAVVMENGGIKMPTGGQALDYLTHMYADFDRNLVRMDQEGFRDGQPTKQTMFYDFNAHKLYYETPEYCGPTTISTTMPELCVSHNSYHYNGRHVVGSTGDNIITDSWSTTFDNVTMTFYLTEDCHPLFQIYTYLTTEYPTQAVLTFSSFKEGVEADKLTPPPRCHT